MKKIAVLILNRNLPKVTDKLYETILRNNKKLVDIFIIDSGSNKKNISKYTTWRLASKEILKKGLRYGRGMNYGLLQLWKEQKFEKYNAFLLITNDTEFPDSKIINK